MTQPVPPPTPLIAGRWQRNLLVATAALGLALLLAQTAIFHRLDLEMLDLQMRMLSPPQDMSGVVGIDVDEKSMDVLEGRLGAWPYDREVFALVTDFLHEAGATAIIYDIVFAEARKGDAAFGAAIKRAARVALPAAPNSAYSFERGPAYEARLARLAWSTDIRLPHVPWPDITLPVEALSVYSDQRVLTGAIAINLDPDGVLRRMALFHESRGYLLPAQPLAALFAGETIPPIAYDGKRGTARIGKFEFPLDEQGEVLLRYSAPAEPAVLLPFYQIVLAALNAPGGEAIRARIQGKKVFIGSTAARLNDFRATPTGIVAGLQILMQASVMFERGEVLLPPSQRWNLLLTAIALAIPLLFFHRMVRMHPLAGIATSLFMSGVVIVLSALLFTRGQAVLPLFPLAAGLAAHLLLSLVRLYALRQERQRLTFEKLAAEESTRLKSQFMSHMTHELRTPLTAILGFNRLIGEGRPDGMQQAHYQSLVEKNGRHLLTLINNILDAARIEAGQMSVTCAPTTIREVIEEAVDTLQPLAREKNLQFTAHVTDHVPARLDVDGLRLKQILLNLAGNAIKFTTRGAVGVGVAWANDTLTIRVTDTGPGIPQAALERIFQPFDQGDASALRRLGGSGLGLAISRSLCELMGGSLSVESSLGKGTSFIATLHAPIAAVASSIRPASSADRRLAGRVLLVEDNIDARDLIALQLAKLGLTVIEATDGAAAVATALREKPDLVLMDMQMPVMSGFEATRALRGSGFGAPIIAVSAHTGHAELEQLQAAGCNGHVAKPINFDTLFHTLNDHLQAA
jgi:signal transduction histidine kinase/CheY-like chemotaxis protein